MTWNDFVARVKPNFGLGVILGIFGAVALLSSFQIGRMVGFRKASFACGWNKNYGLKMQNVPNPDGAFGKILRINGNTLIVKDEDGTEKIVLTSATSTTIRKGMDTMKSPSFNVDDTIAVFGKPTEDGQIHATLIRVLKPE